jgi:hypothetical protein
MVILNFKRNRKDTIEQYQFSINFNKQKKYFGVGFDANVVEAYDYYEPRAANRFVIRPTKIEDSSTFRPITTILLPLILTILCFLMKLDEIPTVFQLVQDTVLAINYHYIIQFFRQNNKGYIDSINEDMNAATPNTIIFANRNVITYSNTLSGKYALNSQMTF